MFHYPSHPSMQARRRRSLGLFVTCAAAMLVITACAPLAEPERGDAPAPDPTVSQGAQSAQQGEATANEGSALLEVAGRTFTFELRSCMVASDGEILLHGPGVENGSDVHGYFDGDVSVSSVGLSGEFRVDIGADSQFDSSDEFVAMGGMGEELEITEDGDDYSVVAPAWDQDGTGLGPALVRFRC